MAGPLTLGEAKQALNMSPGASDDDAELLRFLNAATEQVESYVGPLAAREVVERHDRVRGGTLCLRVTPVLTVTSIAARIGGATLYETADLDVDGEAGLVQLAYGGHVGCTYGGVIVTYTAGRENVPQSLRVATGIILDHLWQTQRGWASGAPTALGEFEATGSPVPMGFALPARAVELLEPYRQIVFG